MQSGSLLYHAFDKLLL